MEQAASASEPISAAQRTLILSERICAKVA